MSRMSEDMDTQICQHGQARVPFWNVHPMPPVPGMGIKLTKFFPEKAAGELADKLNSEDQWTYEPKRVNGYWIIEVYDENGEFIGRL